MADNWTDADEKQLDALQQQYNELTAQQAGNPVADAHVAAVSKPRTPQDEATKPFSLVRTIIGTGRDIIAEPLNFAEAAGDKLEEKMPLPMLRFGENSSNGILDIVSGEAARKEVQKHRQLPSIPDVPGSDQAGAVERITRGIAGFLVPYAGWSKKFGVAKAGVGIVGRLVRGAEAGFATNLVNQAPDATNMASAIKDTFGIDNETLNWLSYHQDEDQLTQRLKAAASNIPVGLAADGLFELGAKAIRAYGAIRGEAEEARGIVEAMEHDYGVKRIEQPSPAAMADAEAGGAAAPVPAQEPYQSALHVAIQEAKPKTWEDILSFLERTVDDPKLKDDELHELAKIAEGDPENALARLGIEPSKLNWHEFDNPDGIRNLHQSLINIYEKIGQRLGRTGETITEAEIHKAARSFASDAEVLKTLYGATKNLPEILMGARMFVGGHAHTLLGDAEAALEALRKDNIEGGEGAWQQFLQTFHRHALYLGTVRGAGSEIGRALKSLQFVARGDLKGAKGLAKDLEKKVQTAELDGAEGADRALDGMSKVEDPAERIMVLSKILEKQGDIGELAQFVRGKAGSPLQRADGVMRESISNLFSTGTAAYNIKSGLSMLFYRGMARWMAAVARLPMAVAGGEQARLFRIAAMDAWYYTDGIFGALGEAVGNTVKVLEREASSELYINADNLGLKKLAKKAALVNAKNAKAVLGKNFERVDIDATPRQFAFNPADRRALEELMDSETLPTAVFRALQWLTRAVGAGANATGTLTRLGTILFINGPDQFVGTMAARAGAQSAAIREAAARAAELGIEGKDLTKYLAARVASLTSDISGWSDKGFEDGFREVVRAAGEHEARAVLFQDELEFNGLRRLSKAIGATKFASLAVPFPHTPLRILERTAIDFTPLGLLKSRFRQAVLHGTPQQREQALAQMALGVFTMGLAYRIVSHGDRGIVGNDGSFTSTSRLNRESYTLRLFGDVYEFSRDDPMGTLLGLAADYKTYMDSVDPDDPEAEKRGQAMFEAGAWAATANMLSKTWLQSMKNLTDLAGAITQGQFAAGLHQYINKTVARRVVPGAGLQKGVEMAFDPWERQATTFNEEMLKYTIGAGKLPPKVNWLGEPEPKNLGERFIGLTWKPEEAQTDKLIRELDRLGLSDKLPDKDIKGVPLTSEQYSRLLELRGNGVVRDYGTLKQALTQLVNHPLYSRLTDPAKANQIRKVAEGYSHDAANALMKEDPELLARVIRKQAYDQGRIQSLSQTQLQKQNAELGRALGLTP